MRWTGTWRVDARCRTSSGEVLTRPAAGPFETAQEAMAQRAVLEADHRAGYGRWMPPFTIEYSPA